MRTVLKQDIKERLLGSEMHLARLAKFRGVKVQNTALLIKKDSPSLTEWDTLFEIMNILELDDIYNLVEKEDVGDKHLHHE